MRVAKRDSEIKKLEPEDQKGLYNLDKPFGGLKKPVKGQHSLPEKPNKGISNPHKPFPANPKDNDDEGFTVWAEYKLDKKLTTNGRLRYEWFCAGYLYYYDVKIRNNSVDHILKIEWPKDNKTVVIKLYPGPERRLKNGVPATEKLDPPKPPAPPPPPMGD